jgi:uncharacterized protein YbjQ (UPF0145 family)
VEPSERDPSTQPGDSAPEEDVPEQADELTTDTEPTVGADPIPPNGWSSGFDAEPSSQPDPDDLPGGSEFAAPAIAESPEAEPEANVPAPVDEPQAEDLPAEPPIDVTPPYELGEGGSDVAAPAIAESPEAEPEANVPAPLDEPQAEDLPAEPPIDVTPRDDLDEAAPSQPAPIDLPWPSAAETPAAGTDAAAWSMGADRSGSSGWGALWRQSAQGWVEDAAGRAVWRPIVTTSATLSEWEVDTYLGLVTGDLAISADDLEAALSAARQVAIERMVDDALARGAHAVIGVSVDLVEVAERVVVSAAGTAVTLKTSE